MHPLCDKKGEEVTGAYMWIRRLDVQNIQRLLQLPREENHPRRETFAIHEFCTTRFDVP